MKVFGRTQIRDTSPRCVSLITSLALQRVTGLFVSACLSICNVCSTKGHQANPPHQRACKCASARIAACRRLCSGLRRVEDRRVDKLGKKDMEALVERLGHGASLRELTLHRTQAPDGTISERWQIDNDEDLRLFRKSQTWANAAEVAAIGALDPGHTVQPKASLPQVAEVIVLSKAREAWLATIKSRTLPKTYTIKMAAVDSLVAFWGQRPSSIRSRDLIWLAGISTCGRRVLRHQHSPTSKAMWAGRAVSLIGRLPLATTPKATIRHPGM